jgi:hypothetical protein
MALQFNDSAMAFSRQAGLTAKQAQAYTEVLTTRAKDLGEKYGIAAEEVAKLEKNLSRATGRVLMLSNAQADMQVAINRTVGEDTANEFAQTIMRTMGGQLSTVQGAVSKAYATAAKKGLDAAGMAAKVGQNLSMANRLTFRNGIDGLTRMVALSEKMGFNMQSLESAAGNFMNINEAIENSAKLSMLGGAAGAMGGNPLDMSYEANYDPEAFGERMTKMLGGYAQFDEKTGMAKMNAMSRDFVNGIADAMGISRDEAISIAKKNAEVTYKNNKFGRDLDRLSGGDENKRDFLLNKTQIRDGQMQMYSSKTGKYENMDYFQDPNRGKSEFDEMMKFSGMSDEEIVREQAEAVVSIRDKIEGWVTSLQAMMAEKISPFLTKIQAFLGDIYKMVVPHAGAIAENIKKLIEGALKEENMNKIMTGIQAVVDTLGAVGKFITSDWIKLLGAMFFIPLIGAVKNIAGSIGKLFGGRKNAATPAKKGAKPYKNRTWKQAKSDANRGMSAKKGSSFAKGRSGLKTLFRNSRGFRNAVRGTAGIGAVLGAVDIASTISDYSSKKEQIEKDTSLTDAQKKKQIENASKERNRDIAGTGGAMAGGSLGAWIGGAIGTAIAPGVGTAIGAALGGAIVGWLGSKGGEAAADAVQGKPETHSTGGTIGGASSKAGDIITNVINKNPEYHSNGGVVGGGSTNIGNTIMNMSTESHSTGGTIGGNVTNLGSSIMNLTTEKHSVGGAVGGNITNAGDTIMTVSNNSTEKHSSGGSVGRVTKPEGEDILTWLKKGEIVLNERQQKMFTDNIQAMPVGQKEYIYVPQNTSTSNVGNNKVIVDAIKVNVGGTIRIDMGGGNTRELDSRAYDIIAQKVSEYFTNQFNLKAVNDTAYVSGAFMPTSLYGKMKTTT